MDKDHKKAKKLVIGLLILCICIALICFGICAYLVIMSRGEGVDRRIVTITQSIALVGVFFLVLAFGYLLPVLLSGKGGKTNSKGSSSTSGIFDETNMRHALEKYIPDGETLLAGIHAVANESSVIGVFGKCICTENSLIPAENASIITLKKEKHAAYDVYIGITQYSLVMADCIKNNYFYQLDNEAVVKEGDVQELTSELFLTDIGKCFPLADIQNCEIKKGWMGSVKCFVKMKNGSYFKLMFPKLGGLGGGMPHHAEYREAIIARLSSGNGI